jgi:trimethylamine--corrinoid protein Co-methyltransferase
MSIPNFRILNEEILIRIIDEAMNLLEKIGFFVENDEALNLLGDNGLKINKKTKRVYSPRWKTEEFLSKLPKSISFYNREGELSFTLEDDIVVFTPGSAALNILDYENRKIRPPITNDAKIFHSLLQKLDFIKAQSTALIYDDVPYEIADSYRLYLALLYCSKPIVTGTFRKESFSVMKDLLLAIRGSEKNLKEKPLAIFDACPSPPLKWSDLTVQSIIDCARNGIPIELISMPIAGATSPVTLKDTLVQHTAETISGILISQSTYLGAPVIYGGSPSILDMRYGTTPMGAIETMLLDCGFAQIGKYFSLPTHAYMGLSDSKQVDYQAGFESGIGIILSTLSGINMVAGAGMLNFENCQSFEKLLLDNEICGMAYRLQSGINFREEIPITTLFERLISKCEFLDDPHTLKWFREELFFPGNSIDRSPLKFNDIKLNISSMERAHHHVVDMTKSRKDEILPDYSKQLCKIMEKEAKKYGFYIKTNN